MALWIEYDGVRRTPESWGVTVASLNKINLTADELRLTTKTKTLGAPIFAYGEKIVLWIDDERIFVGEVKQPSAAVEKRSEGWEYLVQGPFGWLEECPFLQGRVTFGTIDNPSEEEEEEFTSRVVLSMSDVTTPINN